MYTNTKNKVRTW